MTKPTTRDDDTLLDALASQVRAHPPLSPGETDRLLTDARAGGASGAAATDRLISHQLGTVLDEALRHRTEHLDLADLFQEGGAAATEAVRAHVGTGGDGGGLGARVRGEVAGRLDAVVAAATQAHADVEAFVRDSRLLDLAEVALRQKLGHEPTTAELALTLEWTEERVVAMHGLLAEARALNDESLIPFLDDLDEDATGVGS